MKQKEISCCFTGHRKLTTEEENKLAERLFHQVTSLIGQGILHFYTGGALGFDTMAARTILALKRQNKKIQLHLILPCKEQDKYWNSSDHFTYQKILWESDSVEYVSDQYFRGCMHERNRQLVNHASFCICYLTNSTGGTAFTVNYARKKGLTIINLADLHSQVSLFDN